MNVLSRYSSVSRPNLLVSPFNYITSPYLIAEAYYVSNSGTDFKVGEELEIPKQVARLIDQATNLENLCQHYIGMSSSMHRALLDSNV